MCIIIEFEIVSSVNLRFKAWDDLFAVHDDLRLCLKYALATCYIGIATLPRNTNMTVEASKTLSFDITDGIFHIGNLFFAN